MLLVIAVINNLIMYRNRVVIPTSLPSDITYSTAIVFYKKTDMVTPSKFENNLQTFERLNDQKCQVYVAQKQYYDISTVDLKDFN